MPDGRLWTAGVGRTGFWKAASAGGENRGENCVVIRDQTWEFARKSEDFCDTLRVFLKIDRSRAFSGLTANLLANCVKEDS